MKQVKRLFSRLVKNEEGYALVLVTAAMVVLFGFAALVTDIGLLMLNKQKLQNTMDAATLAGAQELPDNPAQAVQMVKEYAQKNNYDPANLAITISGDNKIITITGNKDVHFIFAKVLGISSSTVSATAAAEIGSPGYAFDYTLFSGSTSYTLRFNGNDLLVNGTAHTNENFRVNGNRVEVTGACEAVGTITANGNNIFIPYRFPSSSYVEMPDYEDEVHAQAQAAGQVFNTSMHYNGNNINVDNSIYVNGDVHLNGNIINGSGAILSTGDIHINGNCINATTHDQVCIYSKGDIHINGNNITIDGILYAPEGAIYFNGNNIAINGKVIGYTVRFNGNDISITGDSCSVRSLPGEGCRLII